MRDLPLCSECRQRPVSAGEKNIMGVCDSCLQEMARDLWELLTGERRIPGE